MQRRSAGSMQCKYRSGTGTRGKCALNFYGGSCTDGNMKRCVAKGQNKPKPKIQGLGDIVHTVAQPIAKTIDRALGTNIQGCGGCKRRREKLNDMFPISVE